MSEVPVYIRFSEIDRPLGYPSHQALFFFDCFASLIGRPSETFESVTGGRNTTITQKWLNWFRYPDIDWSNVDFEFQLTSRPIETNMFGQVSRGGWWIKLISWRDNDGNVHLEASNA